MIESSAAEAGTPLEANEETDAPEAQRLVVFGEEIVLDPPLVALLTEIERRLAALAARYGHTAPDGRRVELLDTALDDLECALDRVRDARGKLGRIEVRLAAAHERALAVVREIERDGARAAPSD